MTPPYPPQPDPASLHSSAPTAGAAGTPLKRVVIVGTGLIGTSCALALRQAGVEVFLHDHNTEHLRLASLQGAGTPGAPPAHEPVQVVLIATPPEQVPALVQQWQQRYRHACISDVSSAAARVRRRCAHLGVQMARFVSGHPMAGGENSGPSSARADLFRGRSWFVAQDRGLDPDAVALVEALAQATGAQVVRASVQEHDQAVALTSHVPHVLSSLLAGQLVQADELTIALAGPGLREMTRIAGGSPQLWAQIIGANAGAIAGQLEHLSQQLGALAQQLSSYERDTDSGGPIVPGSGSDEAAFDASQVQAEEPYLAAGLLGQVLSHGVAGRRRLL